MRLEQLRYTLAYKDENLRTASPLENGDVFLCLNGIKSTIKIEDIFTSIQDKDEESIKGYSPLQYILDNPTEELKTFCLQDEKGQEVIVSSKESPLVQWNDKTFDDDSYTKLTAELMRECTPTPAEEIEPSEVEQEEAVVEEATANPDLLYNKYKDKFIKAGYLVKEEGNISLFYLPEDIDDNVVIIRTKDDAEISELEKTEDGVYKYENETEVLMVTKIGDEITFQHNLKPVSE